MTGDTPATIPTPLSTMARRHNRYRYCKLCHIADRLLTALGYALVVVTALYFGGHLVASLVTR